MVAPCLVDLHDIAQIVFEHSSGGLKIRKAAREELYNFLCKKNVKKNCRCSALKVPNHSSGLQKVYSITMNKTFVSYHSHIF
jgi:hypothetical protein